MSDETVLWVAILTRPDDDAPRLAYADRLAAAGDPAWAELIRVQVELARPGADGGNRAAALRRREFDLLAAHRHRLLTAFREDVPVSGHLDPGFRRGFWDALGTPVQWFLRHGGAIRRTLPTLRLLSVYRLNGWGRQLAECAQLAGIRELVVPCWFDPADGIALAESPHLGDLDRLTLWVGGGGDEAALFRALGRSTAWPRLRELVLVWDRGPGAEAVNAAAGRPVARAADPRDRTFPFAADFCDAFFVGKLPDGRPVFAAFPDAGGTAIPAVVFDAAGVVSERLDLPIPPALVLKPKGKRESFAALDARRAATYARYPALLREHLGAVPAAIRVRQFDLEAGGIVCGVAPMSARAEDACFRRDDTGEDIDHLPHEFVFGYGADVEHWVGDGGSFVFLPGDGSDPWHVGGAGRIEST